MESQSTILVANRGEIAIRIIRAARELDLRTIGVFAEQDKQAIHRHVADVSYMIGNSEQFGPIEAYLQGEKIVEIAQCKKVDYIHPGYGFLSENASFATAVRKAGIEFVGPPTRVIEMMGEKVAAKKAAEKCGIPTIPGVELSEEFGQALVQVEKFIKQHGFPVVLKANFGGGGRGIRVLHQKTVVKDALQAASSEAASAFGNGSIFLEKYLEKPKHIEVQILADKHGNCIHLFDRDCSVQRKYQKIIEIAPSPTLSSKLRDAILKSAVKLARSIQYENAGTVEFLVENDRFYFIEMNPRIQVEHTITEETTGVDIVKAQLEIAAGKSLPDLELSQNDITIHGSAIQCRVTTEVPSDNFRPDTGKLEFCRLPQGPGIRLDFSDLVQGASITPYYDPLLLKCVVKGANLRDAIKKSIRALTELQIEGVETNIAFLCQVLSSECFRNGQCWTTFVDHVVHLSVSNTSNSQSQKFLYFLADGAVNGSRVVGQTKPPALTEEIQIDPLYDTATRKPIDVTRPCQDGWRQVLLEHGPVEFAKRIRKHKSTLITDTTWRDGQQSLLATRVRTRDLAKIATHTSHAFRNAYSLESWGGATFDVALRFLWEDPWERLRYLRKLIPNIPFQMLLRSTNGVAYSALPDNAIFHFVKLAKDAGMDIFRIFDCLNNLDNLAIGIQAVLAAGGVVEGAIMYTGDMMDKKCKYSLDYYMSLTEKLVEMGCHILAIKSMSGVMKPNAGRALVRAIRTKFPDLPIHMHTHDTNGAGVATMMACVDEGADVIDTAIDSISGSTSQPAMSATLAALEGRSFDTHFSLDQVCVIDSYWARLRLTYCGFDAELRSPDPTIYQHEIPGGQYSNLVFQARQNGLGSQWQETLRAYADANRLLGDIIKATPTSKAVGDLAQFMVDRRLSYADVLRDAAVLDFPSSVLDYFQGLMGQPFDGFPEELRTKVLRSQRPKLSSRPGLSLKPIDFEEIRKVIYGLFPDYIPSDFDISSYIMYPEVYCAFRKACNDFGDLKNLPTPNFLVPPKVGEEVSLTLHDGLELIATLISIGPAEETSGKREVFFRLNGEFRSVIVLDEAAAPKERRIKADTLKDNEIGAPISGKIIRVLVEDGKNVKAGETLLALTAMKMELNVSAKVDGEVSDMQVKIGETVEKGDLLLRIAT